MGYLICDKCGGYYELHEDESPDDFESCECGGKLRYVESLNDKDEKMIFCPTCGIKIFANGTFCGNCGYNLKSFNTTSTLLSQNKIPLIINWKLIVIAVIICFILEIFISFILATIGLSMVADFNSCKLHLYTINWDIYWIFSKFKPKNGLFNGLIAGLIAGILNLVIGIGLCIFEL